MCVEAATLTSTSIAIASSSLDTGAFALPTTCTTTEWAPEAPE